MGKDPVLATYVDERVVLRTKDIRQAIQVGKLCDSTEEVDRFDCGVLRLRQMAGSCAIDSLVFSGSVYLTRAISNQSRNSACKRSASRPVKIDSSQS